MTTHAEGHRTHRIGWLRAAVLGAGLAGMVAGAMSMAARADGAALLPGAARMTFWGPLAMGLTALVGALVGARI